MLTFIKGFAFGGGLIIAIGAQNAFVLSQGIKKNYFLIIPLICALCDTFLITLGVTGAGRFIASNQVWAKIAGLAGSGFLILYGAAAFNSAIKGHRLNTHRTSNLTFKTAVGATLAVTLLNPHVYLDTVLLMGSISSQFQSHHRFLFGSGAATASFAWFFLLSLGGSLLEPFFRKERSWRILDTCVGITMWTIAISVIKGLPAVS